MCWLNCFVKVWKLVEIENVIWGNIFNLVCLCSGIIFFIISFCYFF